MMKAGKKKLKSVCLTNELLIMYSIVINLYTHDLSQEFIAMIMFLMREEKKIISS